MKIILLNYQNKCCRMLKPITRISKLFWGIAHHELSFPHNYFDDSKKLFSHLYLVEFLNISIKSLFPCIEARGNSGFPMSQWPADVFYGLCSRNTSLKRSYGVKQTAQNATLPVLYSTRKS